MVWFGSKLAFLVWMLPLAGHLGCCPDESYALLRSIPCRRCVLTACPDLEPATFLLPGMLMTMATRAQLLMPLRWGI